MKENSYNKPYTGGLKFSSDLIPEELPSDKEPAAEDKQEPVPTEKKPAVPQSEDVKHTENAETAEFQAEELFGDSPADPDPDEKTETEAPAPNPEEKAKEINPKKEETKDAFGGIDLSEMKVFFGKAAGAAGKAADKAKAAAEQAKKKIDESSKIPAETTPEEEVPESKEGIISDEHAGSRYMSSGELWTWLKKDSKRQQFFTDEISQETEEEYVGELTKKLEENKVPVKIEKRNIRWDRSKAAEEVYVAVPETKVVNPITCMIQFSHVGKYTFVEEKTFITPPDLPPVPHKKLSVDSKRAALALYLGLIGLGLLFVGMTFRTSAKAMLILMGLAFLGVSGYLLYRNKELLDYNKRCEEELRKWNMAWDKWKTSIFLHSFQEDVNGQLSRIFDSVYASISQLNEEKFKGKKTMETQDSNDMNELEQMIGRKQAEYR